MRRGDPPTVDEELRERLLRGEFEAERLPEQFTRHHPVPRYGHSPVNEWGRLYEPFLDQHYLAGGGKRPTWPDDADFAVCLTHDLDAVSSRSPRQALRKGTLRARERWRARSRPDPKVTEAGAGPAVAGLAGGILRAVRGALARGTDPIQQFESWVAAEAAIGATSTFFVPPESPRQPHVSDPVFRYDDPVRFDGRVTTVGELLRGLEDRGVEIGLHPTWYAYDDPDELARQRRQLASVVDGEVESVRQHWLHYDIRRTPAAQAEAGFRYDSTLGVTGNVGFRFGTAYPWRLYDLEVDRELELLELPLLVQDTSLFDASQLALDGAGAIRYLDLLADRVEAVGGVFTLNWHPNSTRSSTHREVYERALERLAERDVWFGTVRDVGEWWRAHNGELAR